MNDQINQLRKRIERFLEEEERYATAIEEEQNNIIMDKVFPWIFRNVISVLVVSVIIDIMIIFSVSVETTMSRWFWLKEPLSLCTGFIIVKFFQHIFGYFRSRKI